MSRDFGNEQDMPQADKLRPNLGPTEEAQDVASLNRVIVPMPAFTNPLNPDAAAGSINLSLDTHPVSHDKDYGAGVTPGHHAALTGSMLVDESERKSAQRAVEDTLPEERGEWQKKDWQAQARAYGLSTSGNMDTLKGRVEEYEAEQAEAQEERAKAVEDAKDFNAGDWISQVESAKSAEDLDELQSIYAESGADFKTVAEAFDAKRAELSAAGES